MVDLRISNRYERKETYRVDDVITKQNVGFFFNIHLIILEMSLHSLPLDIIYRILDNLDERQILLSLSNVCPRLNKIIHSYRSFQVIKITIGF